MAVNLYELKKLFKKINYENCKYDSVRKGETAEYGRIIRHLFFKYDEKFTRSVIEEYPELYRMSDEDLWEQVFLLSRPLFQYFPKLKKEQFLQDFSFVKHKIQFLIDIIGKVTEKWQSQRSKPITQQEEKSLKGNVEMLEEVPRSSACQIVGAAEYKNEFHGNEKKASVQFSKDIHCENDDKEEENKFYNDVQNEERSCSSCESIKEMVIELTQRINLLENEIYFLKNRNSQFF
ncbi:hypothetical protein SNEBB_010512 [Seison nebaliae]|nr:hypothetical protein SNEBB_010512 [Seison nebaliae]